MSKYKKRELKDIHNRDKFSEVVESGGAAMFGIQADILWVRGLLPEHYTVEESKKPGSIHCVSKIGIKKDIDSEDDEHWEYVFQAIRARFGNRFQEVFHNVCFCHTDFTIYLKPNKPYNQ